MTLGEGEGKAMGGKEREVTSCRGPLQFVHEW